MSRMAQAREALRSRRIAHTSAISVQDALEGVSPTRRPPIERRLAEMPESFKRTYLKAVGGRSRPAAVRAFCAECMGYDREGVTECTSLACALWPYRPYQVRQKAPAKARGEED